MTRGRLIARVAAAIGLSVTGEELTLLQEWADEAVVDVLLRTHCRVELGDITLSAGVGDYRLDTNVLAVEERSITGATYGYNVVSLGDIYEMRLRDAAAPVDQIIALAVEGDLMLVYPTPTATQTIRYVYVAKPTAMTSDSHDPSTSTYGGIPTEYHDCIETYMLREAAKYDGKTTSPTWAEYDSDYDKKCAYARKETRKKAKRGLLAARVGYPGRSHVGRRNDVYPRY